MRQIQIASYICFISYFYFMPITSAEAGMLFFGAALGLCGGFIGTLVANKFERWRQLDANPQSKQAIIVDFGLELVVFLIGIFVLIMAGRLLISP
jgi:H+/Cl- antiporter ClcA